LSIYSQAQEVAIERISKKDIHICVIGVGTIGLPLATFLAKNGFSVKGLDINEQRVSEINSGNIIYEYQNDLKILVKEKKLVVTTDVKDALENAEIIFVCVPTPLNKNNEMDISNLTEVAERIKDYLKKGMFLIFESSVAIGTTAKIASHIENLTDLKFGVDLGLAYCPERYNPTPMEKIQHDKQFNSMAKGITFPLDKINRIVGGIDKKSTELAKTIYSQFIVSDVTTVSSIETAEATKLIENIFRDVNIALVNEFAKIFPKFNLDIFEIIDAAKTKPFGFMPHYPGAGVGGECIPVDTWYLISQAEQLGVKSELMKIARQINDSMPNHMVQMLESELTKTDKKINLSKISILGLCYKKNIPDIRLSPALEIISILKEKNASVVVCDPVFDNTKSPVELVSLNDVFKGTDAILLVTDHDVFSSLNFSDIKKQVRTPLIIDGRNFFSKSQLEELGFTYCAIGKP
jgi:nucleotide sugar dehydrogenase